MNDDEVIESMYNDGERLVPFITHNDSETVRHFSSYRFFCKIIRKDIEALKLENVSILDVGFGCGYGCSLLANIDNVKLVTGIDVEPLCKEYAEKNFSASNIKYVIEEAESFIKKGLEFDYITSRGVLEHIPNGITLIGNANFSKRLIFDVPYNEKPGNKHHLITGITEKDFSHFNNCEVFYESLDGTIFDVSNRPDDVNMVLCVQSLPDMLLISEMFTFPILPIPIEEIRKEFDIIKTKQINKMIIYYDDAAIFIEKAKEFIESTDTIIDIGPGIRPMDFFTPKLHLMVEPYHEYVEILQYRYAGVKNVIIISEMAQTIVPRFTTNAVDSIFMLDFIEHLPKEEGILILQHAERIARRQVVVFTPLDYMPQNGNYDKKDGWGLKGADFQRHLSGWCPDDFDSEWDFHICEKFHFFDGYGRNLSAPHGAFFAIKTFNDKPIPSPASLNDLHFISPIEAQLNQLKLEMNEKREQLNMAHGKIVEMQAQLNLIQDHLLATQQQLKYTKHRLESSEIEVSGLMNIVNHPVVRLQRKVWRLFHYKNHN